ncbi:uracil-DNA glycosylase [Sulfurospirillum sp. 1612]|uniref:uracil-DNA glycosylase n=1 Tax=Sulfurospirillum sp. 1612 TaxID=3094835 RepID=UPI002F95863B
MRACYDALDQPYREFLEQDRGYFPHHDTFLNAFKTLRLEDTKYILFGQDPYPRKESAIGYAFIDGLVDEIFTDTGLSKPVNKATSLRNFIKMLCVAQGVLPHDNTSQQAISQLPKEGYIRTIFDLKENFEKNGVLLLNTSLIFTSKKNTMRHARAFLPFMDTLLQTLKDRNIEIILFGNTAKMLEKKLPFLQTYTLHKMPHPYNVSFIKDPTALTLFAPMKLLNLS